MSHTFGGPSLVIDQIPDAAGEIFVHTDSAWTMFRTCSTPGGRPGPRRCRGHPSCGGHQPGADDPVDRPAGPKHPRRQLVTALPRHGSVDDRLSRGIRRTFHADVADGVSAGRSAGFRPCPKARGEAVWSPPRRTSPTSGPLNVACPHEGDDIDFSNVVTIIGSEPVSIDAIQTFNKAFAPYGLPRTRVQALLRHRGGDTVRRDHRSGC